MMQNTLFSSVHAGRAIAVLMLLIGMVTASYIVGVMIPCRKNWASIANYMECIIMANSKKFVNLWVEFDFRRSSRRNPFHICYVNIQFQVKY